MDIRGSTSKGREGRAQKGDLLLLRLGGEGGRKSEGNGVKGRGGDTGEREC